MTSIADAGMEYMTKGWHPIPLPRGEKYPPPDGTTGRGGVDLNGPDFMALCDDHPEGNLGLRLGPDVIGLDVDHYGSKTGFTSLQAAAAELGPLPRSWRSTSRGARDPSGIRYFRVPAGRRWTWPRRFGSGVDIIQRTHRYAVVWPSIHPEGRPYEWIGPGGIPAVADLPELPEAWLGALGAEELAGDERIEAADDEAVGQWLGTGSACLAMRSAAQGHVEELAAPDVAAHDVLVSSLTHLAKLHNEGHSGVRRAVGAVGKAFIAQVTGEHRGRGGGKRRSAAAARIEAASALRWVVAVAAAEGRSASECQCSPPTPQRSIIPLTDEVSAVRAVRSALGTGSLRGVYQLAGRLVWAPSPDRRIQPIEDREALRTLLMDHAYLYRTDDNGSPYEAMLSPRHAAAVLSRLDDLPNVPTVREVVSSPVLLADGSIVQQPGHHPGSGLLYLPGPGYRGLMVPEDPHEADVAAALELVERMVGDFPFADDDAKANYLALLMAPAIRRMLDRPLPLGMFTAPAKGSGKTYLADGLRAVWGGTMYGGLPSPEELPKKVTAALQVPGSVVVFDNVKTTVAGEALEALLTSSVWRDRVLGTQRMIEVPNTRLWCMTSNNARIGEDVARRMVAVRIDPGMERPYLRNGFTISDWPGWVAEHAEELRVAVLTLVRYALGRGPVARARTDAYGPFVDLANHVLSCCGVPGEVMGLSLLDSVSSPEMEELHDFLVLVRTTVASGEFTAAAGRPDHRWTAKELMTFASEFRASASPQQMELASLVAGLGSGSRGTASTRSVGHWLARNEGNVVGGLRIQRNLKLDGIQTWAVVETLGTSSGADPRSTHPRSEHES